MDIKCPKCGEPWDGDTFTIEEQPIMDRDPDTVQVTLSRKQAGELLGWSTRDIADAARAALEAN